jgi:glycosyltransferase involved in cell wall biosynthesis
MEEAWSRIPSGLARGLIELGFDPVLVDAEPLRSITRIAKAWAMVFRSNRHGGMFAPEVRELRRITARLRARRIGDFDVSVQMGSDFGIPLGGRFVTYEDTTVPQRVRLDDLETVLGATAVSRWISGQRRCYEAAAGCCAMSQWAADSIVEEYGIEREKVHVVWAGRNCNPRPVKRDWTRPRFFLMGYDWRRKNGELVLRAFGTVRERVPDARLDIAGDHPRIDAEGVFAHGPLDLSRAGDRARAEGLYEGATCFVMPSRFEPFGIVYIEAAAAGVPSIGTVIGGARDAVGDAGGVLVDPADERMLVQAMMAMCNPDRASEMGAAALERSGLFTWAAVAARIIHGLECGAD